MIPRLMPTLAVAIGGALGSIARFWIGALAAAWLGEAFPYGTIFINVAGSFVIGLFALGSLPGGPWASGETARAFVIVGLCGGFTTFSSFSLQTLLLVRGGSPLGAVANILASVGLCLIAVLAGALLAARLGSTLR